MKNIKTLLIFVATALFLTACQKDETPNGKTTIQISGIEYSPNCFTKDGIIQGIDVDIASLAMSNMGIDMKMNIQENWDDAYNATLNGSSRALLTVGYSAERADLFKWVGPTSSSQYIVFSKKKYNYELYTTLSKAKEINSVAVVRGWLEAIKLEEKGFTNLVYFDTQDDAIQAYLTDEVEAIAGDAYQIILELPEEAKAELIPVTRYHTVYYYLAFSKDVGDEIIKKCQSNLETMIRNQSTLSITKQYLPWVNQAVIPGVIQIFTEVAPPLNFYSGTFPGLQPAGSSLEILEELQSRNDFVNYPELSSWTDAYENVQYLPNSALLTTARTPEREHLFQWVGPIATLKTLIYTRADTEPKLETLDQAKVLQSIATPKGWYTHDYLLSHNFQNIVITETPDEAFTKLIEGEVDALIMFEVGAKWLCNQKNIAYSTISGQLEVSYEQGFIAFSLNTPLETVRLWQEKLDDMKADGSFASIWEKWYGDLEMP